MGDADVIAATRIVGRDDEKRLLRERIDGAAAGQPCAVFVHGEAGIGKTSLVRSVVADAGSGRRHGAVGQMPPVRRRRVDVPPVRPGDRGLAAGSTRPPTGRRCSATSRAPRCCCRRSAVPVRPRRCGSCRSSTRSCPGSWRSDRPSWSSTTSSGRLPPRGTRWGTSAPGSGTSRLAVVTTHRDEEQSPGDPFLGWLADMRRMPSVTHPAARPPAPRGDRGPARRAAGRTGAAAPPAPGQRPVRRQPVPHRDARRGSLRRGGLPARRSARRARRGVARRLAPDVVAGPEGGPGAGRRRPTRDAWPTSPRWPRSRGLGARGRGGRGRRGGGAGDHGARSRRGVVPAPPARRGPAGHAAAGQAAPWHAAWATTLERIPATGIEELRRLAALALHHEEAADPSTAVAFSLRAARLAHELGAPRAEARHLQRAVRLAGPAGTVGPVRPTSTCSRARPTRAPWSASRSARPTCGTRPSRWWTSASTRCARAGCSSRCPPRSGGSGASRSNPSGRPAGAWSSPAATRTAASTPRRWPTWRSAPPGSTTSRRPRGRPVRRGGRPTVRLAASPGGGARGPRVRDEGLGQLSRGHRRGPAPGRADRRPRAAGGRLHLAVQLPVGPGAGRRRSSAEPTRLDRPAGARRRHRRSVCSRASWPTRCSRWVGSGRPPVVVRDGLAVGGLGHGASLTCGWWPPSAPYDGGGCRTPTSTSPVPTS